MNKIANLFENNGWVKEFEWVSEKVQDEWVTKWMKGFEMNLGLNE